MHTPLSTFTRLAAILSATAALASGARADEPPAPAAPPAMLTMAQAVTLAEASQKGIAYDMKRTSAGNAVVYRIKLSTPDRGIVKVQVAAYGGRLEVQAPERGDRRA